MKIPESELSVFQIIICRFQNLFSYPTMNGVERKQRERKNGGQSRKRRRKKKKRETKKTKIQGKTSKERERNRKSLSDQIIE